jgi:hypothetical protein
MHQPYATLPPNNLEPPIFSIVGFIFIVICCLIHYVQHVH